MALLFALALFGAPGGAGNAPLETDLRRTDALLAGGRADDALAILLPLRDMHPTDALLDRQLARTYAALRRPDEEAAAWEAFLRKSPAPADACVRLGVLLLERGEAARFVTAAEQCLSRDPGQVEVLSQLALAHEMLGNQPAADEALERALRLDSSNADLRARAARRGRGAGR